MRTTTTAAAEIRAALKASGISSRQVSVRAEYFSLGSALRIQVKDPTVSLATVEVIAQPHEHIRRDETGEILGGGNTHLSVRYSDEALQALGKRYEEAVHQAWNALHADSARPSTLAPIGETGYFLGWPATGRLTLWSERGHVCDDYDIAGIAKSLAIARDAQGML